MRVWEGTRLALQGEGCLLCLCFAPHFFFFYPFTLSFFCYHRILLSISIPCFPVLCLALCFYARPDPPCSSFCVSLCCIVLKEEGSCSPHHATLFWAQYSYIPFKVEEVRRGDCVLSFSLHRSFSHTHTYTNTCRPRSSRFQVCIKLSSPEDKISLQNKP